jgi:hypothetical protein
VSYSPNLPISSGWKSTLSNAFQTLRRVKFIIESDFTWRDFDPQFSANGMTVTNYVVLRSRYFKIQNLMWISVNLTATLAAPLNPYIQIVIPGVASALNNSTSTTPTQGGSCCLQNAGLEYVGRWRLQALTSILGVTLAPVANFTAGNTEILINAVLEVQ